jgi:hypothetical protein
MYSITSSHHNIISPKTIITDTFDQAWSEACHLLSQEIYSYLQVGHFKLEYLIVDTVTAEVLNLDLAGIDEFLSRHGAIQICVLDSGQAIYAVNIEVI